MHLKHTLDKQFWLLETTVVIALNYGPTKKRKYQRAFLLWFIELLFFQIQHCVYQMEIQKVFLGIPVLLNHRDVVLNWLLVVWQSILTDNNRFIFAFPWEEQGIIY